MLRQIPAPLQTIYFNLAQQAIHRAPASVFTRRVAGRTYLSAQERHGAARVQRQIGPADDPDAIREADRLKAEAQAAKNARKLVSALRRAGVSAPTPAMGRVLEVLSNAGLFESGAVVLVGTLAYACYSAPLGFYLPPDLMATEDIDLSVVSFAVRHIEQTDILAILKRADPSFEPIFNSGHSTSLPSKFRSANTMIVETITSLRRSENPIDVPELRSSATALRYQDYLVEEPERLVALYGAGVPLLAPQPARYAVHKLIVAQERSELFKREKDLAQARALFEAAPADAISDALDDARRRGRKWATAVDRGLQLASL